MLGITLKRFHPYLYFCYQNNDRDTCTVMINVPGTMNIDNCKIYGGRQVLFVRCGTATVNNSTITLSSAYNDAGKYDNKVWGSGNEVPMGAVVVGNRADGTAYDTPCNLHIKQHHRNWRPRLYVSEGCHLRQAEYYR